MVKGLNLFRDRFRDLSGAFIIIGGTACSLAMEEAGLEFRATKDIDIVLRIEELTSKFFETFWTFIHDGSYEYRQQSTGKTSFYRFSKPAKKDFPYMLELFSRTPDALRGIISGHLTPIPAEGEISSLSAILLDDEYYRFIHNGIETVNSLPVARPEYIIPLKAKAWLDLLERSARGELVDSSNIRKHLKDIVSLFSILNPGNTVRLEGRIARDLGMFMNAAAPIASNLAKIRDLIATFYGIAT